MTGMQKKHRDWKNLRKTPIVTDLVDPRPRRMVKFLNDYTLLLTTASFSVGHSGAARVTFPLPEVHIQIRRLPHKILKKPLDVLVEPDDQGFLARTTDLPLYGYGEDRIEAIDMLKHEIESLCDELLKDNDLSEEWLGIRRFLAERIGEAERV